jgi:dipeptidyl aminopeptidase/acylaminoacyl peptidase
MVTKIRRKRGFLAGAIVRVLIAFVGAALVAGSASAHALRRPMITDLVPVTGSLAWAPGGQALAASDGSHLVILSYPGGARLADLGPGYLPSWSPAGDSLAFFSTRSGTVQLWLWRPGADPRRITDFPEGVDPDISTRFSGYVFDRLRLSWSPDSRSIALASRVKVIKSRAGGPVVLDNQTPSQLTTAGLCSVMVGCATSLKLSGTSLIDVPLEPGFARISQIFLVDTRTVRVRRITDTARAYWDPVWTADGSEINSFSVDASTIDAEAGRAVAGQPGLKTRLVALDAAGANERTLLEDAGRAHDLMRFAGGFLFRAESPDGRKIETRFVDRGRLRSLSEGKSSDQYEVDATGTGAMLKRDGANSKVLIISPGNFGLSTPRVVGGEVSAWATHGRSRLAFLASDGVLNIVEGHRTRPFHRFRDTAGLLLGKERTVTWQNKKGERRSGSLLLPPGYWPGKRYPMIVDVYPSTLSLTWMHPMEGNQTWAAAGYLVFKPSPRAPHVISEYQLTGGARVSAMGAPWSLALDDVESGIAELDRMGIVDTSRMCLYGHSNGGAVAAYLVTMTNRFRCVVIASPAIVNWVQAVELTDGRRMISEMSGGRDLYRDAPALMGMSAVYNLYKSKTPMLIAVGDEDAGFVSNAVQVFNAVRAAGVPVTLIRYPGQGHVLDGAAMEDFWRHQMSFFRTYLSE